jgi:hypothetical protein
MLSSPSSSWPPVASQKDKRIRGSPIEPTPDRYPKQLKPNGASLFADNLYDAAGHFHEGESEEDDAEGIFTKNLDSQRTQSKEAEWKRKQRDAKKKAEDAKRQKTAARMRAHRAQKAVAAKAAAAAKSRKRSKASQADKDAAKVSRKSTKEEADKEAKAEAYREATRRHRASLGEDEKEKIRMKDAEQHRAAHNQRQRLFVQSGRTAFTQDLPPAFDDLNDPDKLKAVLEVHGYLGSVAVADCVGCGCRWFRLPKPHFDWLEGAALQTAADFGMGNLCRKCDGDESMRDAWGKAQIGKSHPEISALTYVEERCKNRPHK